ncbi:MAG TPA: HAD-IA family hydrolase [Terriglobia bacterium]
MSFRAVLFDAAETLFTTRGSVGEIYANVAQKYGSTVPSEVIQTSFREHFKGAGPLSPENQKEWWKDIVNAVFEEVGMIENFDHFFNEVYDTFRDSQGWMLFPETVEVLQELKDRHLKLGVISNFDSRIYTVMESLHVRHFFDAVVLSSETGFAKPDQEIFDAAIEAIGCPAAEILFVGDSLEDDVEAGSRAGLTTVLIDRTGRHAGQYRVQRIASLKEVLKLTA